MRVCGVIWVFLFCCCVCVSSVCAHFLKLLLSELKIIGIMQKWHQILINCSGGCSFLLSHHSRSRKHHYHLFGFHRGLHHDLRRALPLQDQVSVRPDFIPQYDYWGSTHSISGQSHKTIQREHLNHTKNEPTDEEESYSRATWSVQPSSHEASDVSQHVLIWFHHINNDPVGLAIKCSLCVCFFTVTFFCRTRLCSIITRCFPPLPDVYRTGVFWMITVLLVTLPTPCMTLEASGT